MTKCNLAQLDSMGRIRYLILEVIGDTMYSKWGILGGLEQETDHTYDFINYGKSNELTPDEAAEADFHRKKDKKIKEGYVLVDSLVDPNIADLLSPDVIDFTSPPTSFSPSKPIKVTRENEHLVESLITSGRCVQQVKENGMCHFAFIDEDEEIRIFTRRMEDHTRKYPWMIDEIRAYVGSGKIPTCSVLAIEFLVGPGSGNHRKKFKILQQITKSDVAQGVLKESQGRSYALQQRNPVFGLVLVPLYLNGLEVWRKSCEGLLDWVKSTFPSKNEGSRLFRADTKKFSTLEDIKKFLKSKHRSVEGMVLWSVDDFMEVRFTGKPSRRAAYKIKVPSETDVVAYGWVEGTGDRQGKIGSLLIGKYDSLGNLISLGKVGSGIKDHEADPSDWNFPCVVEIEYDGQFDTGKFEFPRFSKVHEDKLPEECVLEEGEITE